MIYLIQTHEGRESWINDCYKGKDRALEEAKKLAQLLFKEDAERFRGDSQQPQLFGPGERETSPHVEHPIIASYSSGFSEMHADPLVSVIELHPKE
jgi:hypothetical protein